MTQKYGGQAVIEGVMFASAKGVSLGVRKPNGDIHTESSPRIGLVRRLKLHRIWFIRGFVSLLDMLVLGTKMMNKSADLASEDETESKPSSYLNIVYFIAAFVLSLAIAAVLFKFVPLYGATFLVGSDVYPLLFTTVEGILKLFIFLFYLFCIRFIPDIYRVFQYHGAEHMVIRAYEAGKKLTVSAVSKASRFHPRCGTSFLVFVIAISIVLYTIIPLDMSLWAKFLYRLALLPVLAGISFEVLQLLSKLSSYSYLSWLNYPGYAVQALTTAKPDNSQIEVSLASFNACKKIR